MSHSTKTRPINYFYKRNTPKTTSKWIVTDIITTENEQLHPKLPFPIRPTKYKIKYKTENTLGGQLKSLSLTMTQLVRDERIVASYNRATELRGYAERLIVEAMRNGDTHRPTMELADFWLFEKNLVHKLFKVLVPRYINYNTSFTSLHKLGYDYSKPLSPKYQGIWWRGGECVLELKGNPLPPIIKPRINRAGLLTNVLLNSID